MYTHYINQLPKLLLLGFAIFIYSCQSESSISLEHQQFFDLKSYFQQEQDRLSKKYSTVTKIATIDGKTEKQTINEIDFKQELSLFIGSDINKISWLDKYTVDSVMVSSQLSSVNYTAKDDKLKTQFLSVNFQDQKVHQVKILRKNASIAAEMEQELNYNPLKGYSIENRQKTTLSDEHILRLEVSF